MSNNTPTPSPRLAALALVGLALLTVLAGCARQYCAPVGVAGEIGVVCADFRVSCYDFATPTVETWYPPTFTPAPSQTPPPAICNGTVHAQGGLRIRALPTVAGEQVGSLADGGRFRALERSGDGRWFRIEIPAPGWIAGGWVKCD
jgi:hypothetical protein